MTTRARAVLADGLLAGFIGYVTIVVVIALADMTQGWPPFAAVAGGLSPWTVAIATGLAVMVMGVFLWRTRPALRASLHAQPE